MYTFLYYVTDLYSMTQYVIATSICDRLTVPQYV